MLSKMTPDEYRVITDMIAATLAWNADKLHNEWTICARKGCISDEYLYRRT